MVANTNIYRNIFTGYLSDRHRYVLDTWSNWDSLLHCDSYVSTFICCRNTICVTLTAIENNNRGISGNRKSIISLLATLSVIRTFNLNAANNHHHHQHRYGISRT